MKLDPNEKIAGYSAKSVRDLFKWKDRLFSKDAQRWLGCSAKEANVALERLVDLGKLKPPRDGGYEVTLDGHQLGNVTFGGRISRAKAEAMLQEVLRRAAEINRRTDLTDRISEIRVFGSYLTDAPDLGDLDIVVSTERREHYLTDHYAQANLALAEASGRRLSFIERLGFSELEIRRLLKTKLPRLSVHLPYELEKLGVEGRVVFPE